MKDRAPLPRCVGFSLIDKAGLAIRHRRPCFFCASPRYGQKSNIKRRRITLGNACGSLASASKNFLVFAGVPQVSRETFWRLRELRKCLGELFGVCGSPANATFYFFMLAEVPQTPLSSFSCLRKFRKGHFLHFDACGSSANAIFSILMLAEVPQGPFSPF